MNIKTTKAAPEGAGDVWTWAAVDAKAPAPKKRGPYNTKKEISNCDRQIKTAHP